MTFLDCPVGVKEKLGSVGHFPFFREKLIRTKYRELLGKVCLSLNYTQTVLLAPEKSKLVVNKMKSLPIKLITVPYCDGDISFLSPHNDTRTRY